MSVALLRVPQNNCELTLKSEWLLQAHTSCETRAMMVQSLPAGFGMHPQQLLVVASSLTIAAIA